MDFIKIALFACAAAVLYSLVKALCPELSWVVSAAVCTAVLIFALRELSAAGSEFEKTAEYAGIYGEALKNLLKCLAVCIVTELAADVCRENGALSAAGAVTFAGRAAALLCAVPLIMPAAETALGLLK